MQTIEAMISLIVLLAILSSMTIALAEPNGVDDSLYRYQLANDFWRVLYLKGNFENLDNESSLEAIVNGDGRELNELSNLCFFISGIRYSPCRGGNESHGKIASINKVLIIEKKPRQVTFSITE